MIWWRKNWLNIEYCSLAGGLFLYQMSIILQTSEKWPLLASTPMTQMILAAQQRVEQKNGNPNPLALAVLSGFFRCIAWVFMYSQRPFHSLLMGLLSNTCHTFFLPESRNPPLVSASLTPNLTVFSKWECHDPTSRFTYSFWRNTSASHFIKTFPWKLSGPWSFANALQPVLHSLRPCSRGGAVETRFCRQRCAMGSQSLSNMWWTGIFLLSFEVFPQQLRWLPPPKNILV